MFVIHVLSTRVVTTWRPIWSTFTINSKNWYLFIVTFVIYATHFDMNFYWCYQSFECWQCSGGSNMTNWDMYTWTNVHSKVTRNLFGNPTSLRSWGSICLIISQMIDCANGTFKCCLHDHGHQLSSTHTLLSTPPILEPHITLPHFNCT